MTQNPKILSIFSSSRDDEGGFTLMEVLVALVIFSIMATGFTRYVSDRAKQTAYLTDKTLAIIIASNTITHMQIAGDWPPEGPMAQQTIAMADKNWLVDVNVLNTDEPAIRNLNVSVTLPVDAQDKTEMLPLVTLAGFVGKN